MLNQKLYSVSNTNLYFHFMKKDPQTKKWWEKPGIGAIRCIGKVNADAQKYWGLYDKPTVYMAVKRKFTKY